MSLTWKKGEKCTKGVSVIVDPYSDIIWVRFNEKSEWEYSGKYTGVSEEEWESEGVKKENLWAQSNEKGEKGSIR